MSSKESNILAGSLHEIGGETLKAAQFGAAWAWHYGSVSGLGYFETAGGREVVIQWDEGGASRKQGGITDAQWEIFRISFDNGGRIGVLSDKAGTDWKFDCNRPAVPH